MAKVKIRVTGLKPTLSLLNRIRLSVKDLRPILGGPITNSIHQFFRRQFDSQGAAGGEPWPALRPTTLALKARGARGGMGILRASNRLWSSLTKRGGADQIRVVKPHLLEIGTQVASGGFPYPAAHQEGYTQTTVFGKARKRPLRVQQRKIVPDQLPAGMVKAWETLIARRIERA